MLEGAMGEEGEDLEEEDLDNSPASHQLATALGMNAHRIQVMKASFFADQLSPYLLRDAPTVDKALFSGSFGKAGHSKSSIYPAVKPLGPLLSPKVTRCVDEGGQLSQSLFGSPKIGNLTKSCPSVLVQHNGKPHGTVAAGKKNNTVEPLVNSHPWGNAYCPLEGGWVPLEVKTIEEP